jgi:hypothetical protein
MQRLLEQRYAIKFCVKLGKSATETFDKIKQAYPDVALARSGVLVAPGFFGGPGRGCQ